MEEVQIEDRDGDRDPLLILGKIEDMMLYAYPVLNAYPKYERFVLAADIKRCMDQAMERTIEANKKYYKKTTLQELDVEIDKIRKYIRLSYRLKYIDFKKYGSIMVTDKGYEEGRICCTDTGCSRIFSVPSTIRRMNWSWWKRLNILSITGPWKIWSRLFLSSGIRMI